MEVDGTVKPQAINLAPKNPLRKYHRTVPFLILRKPDIRWTSTISRQVIPSQHLPDRHPTLSHARKKIPSTPLAEVTRTALYVFTVW